MQKLAGSVEGVGNARTAGCAQAWKEHATELEGAPTLSQVLQHLGAIRRPYAHAKVRKCIVMMLQTYLLAARRDGVGRCVGTCSSAQATSNPALQAVHMRVQKYTAASQRRVDSAGESDGPGLRCARR